MARPGAGQLPGVLLLLLAAGAAAAAEAQQLSAPAGAASQPAVLAPALAAAQNPLLSDSPFPPWDKIKPEHVGPAVRQVIAEETAALQLLEADLEAAGPGVSFDRIFGPYTQMNLRMDSVFTMIDNLESVLDSDELRDAIKAAAPARTAFGLRMGQSKPLYAALGRLRANAGAWARLRPDQRRLVEDTLQGLRNSGVGLEPAQRARFNAIIDEARALGTNFSNNALDSQDEFKLLVRNRSELAGLEATTLAVAAEKAADAGHSAASSEAGPWLLGLDAGTYGAVVSFAADRGLRQKIFEAYRTIASRPPNDNGPIIDQLLTLRQEEARLLGYKDFAELSASSKMATIPEAIALLGQVEVAAKPVAAAEDRQVSAFARNASGDPGLQLKWWDVSFWAERQKEALFKLKQEELRQYLPLDSVKDGLWRLAGRLFGISVSPAKAAAPVWHKDVQVYQISAAGSDEPLAYFYADLFTRTGQKQSGAWFMGVWDAARYWRRPSPAAAAAHAAGVLGTNRSLPYSPALARAQAEWVAAAPRQVPIGVIISNQDPPTAGRPSLATLDDAETLFHEFGHALQFLLTRAELGLFSGMRGIEWDAVETPSQMLEKWVYDRDTFNGFARHWQTKKPVPAWMFEQIKSIQKYRRGNYFAYQLMLATTDLALHTSYTPGRGLTPAQLQQAIYARLMPYPAWPGDRQVNSFGHIFNGGYAAGYYSYTWADVMSADAYTAFLEVRRNETAVDELGRLFRATVLESGGAVPPAQVFKRFRGRGPEVGPLLAYNGIGRASLERAGAAPASKPP